MSSHIASVQLSCNSASEIDIDTDGFYLHIKTNSEQKSISLPPELRQIDEDDLRCKFDRATGMLTILCHQRTAVPTVQEEEEEEEERVLQDGAERAEPWVMVMSSEDSIIRGKKMVASRDIKEGEVKRN